MGEIIKIDEFQKLREQKATSPFGNTNASPAFIRASQPSAASLEIQRALKEKNIAVLSNIRAPGIHRDIRNYKRNSVNYQLLLAVFEDNLDEVRSLLGKSGKSIDINASTYWHYPTKTDVHFFTPGDLIKSLKMAYLLKSHGADITPYLQTCFTLDKPIPA